MAAAWNEVTQLPRECWVHLCMVLSVDRLHISPKPWRSTISLQCALLPRLRFSAFKQCSNTILMGLGSGLVQIGGLIDADVVAVLGLDLGSTLLVLGVRLSHGLVLRLGQASHRGIIGAH